MKKKINNISLEDAKVIAQWLLSSSLVKKMDVSQIKAVAREHLRIVKQTPDTCLVLIKKEAGKMPSSKSF